MVELIAALLAAAATLLIFLGVFQPRKSMQAAAQRLSTFATAVQRPKSLEELELAQPFQERVVKPVIEYIARVLRGRTPQRTIDNLARDLVLAGNPRGMTPMYLLGLKGALAILLAGTVVLLALLARQAFPKLVLAGAAGGVLGYFAPNLWLRDLINKRKKRLQRALPDAMDLLTISVEAGLGFDAALTQVVKRWHNTLTDEFALLLIDFQIGKARKEAWKELIRRTQVPDLTSFITAMLQNEQVGVSISTLLRTQADQMRVKRRQAAEEAARTAPVKMLIPMVFCIFPGIFVIVLGPAVPQLLGTFMNLGR
jgi:tight adherence protein C